MSSTVKILGEIKAKVNLRNMNCIILLQEKEKVVMNNKRTTFPAVSHGVHSQLLHDLLKDLPLPHHTIW
jgi:hypothetical protein